MANVFDQIQAESGNVSGNVFDQIHADPASLGGFAGNVLGSAANVAGSLWDAVTHPIDTATGIASTAFGGIEKPVRKTLELATGPISENPEEQDFDALVGHFVNRYKSMDALKDTAYKDPVGLLLDLSTLLDGVGAAARTVGIAGDAAKLSRVSQIANSVADNAKAMSTTVNPIAQAAKAIPKMTVIPKLANPNPVVADAVKFAQERGIPIDAATATGNKFVAGAEALADHSALGSIVSQGAKRAEEEAFTRVGGDLAEQASPGSNVAPAQVGSDIADQVRDNIAAHNADADAAYESLRAIEADPANLQTVQVGTKEVPAVDPRTGQTIPGKTMTVPDMQDVPLPVDMRPVKAALKPVYDEITHLMPIAQQRASTGLLALNNVINGPDAMAASRADRNLSAIKAAARGADMPELRTLSQGLAAQAVGVFDDAVTDAVGKAERSAGQSGNAAQASSSAVPVPAGSEGTAAHAGATQQGPVGAQPDRAGAVGAGPETTVTVPGEGTRYDARYELRELADVQPSHNGQTFQPNPKYDLRNDRNYGNPANQRKVVEWSTPENFDPAYHVTDNPDATNGPPLIDSDGNVLGGNGRTMIMQRVYASNPEGAAEYRQMLADRAPRFGIDPAEIEGMKQPVLVRVLDDSHLETPAAKQAAVTDFNKTGTAALTPAERAIADSRRVSPETLYDVAQRLDKIGPDATLAQAIEGRGGVEILHKLVEDGVVSPQEGAGLTTESGLTKAGKDRISSLMLGRFFRDPEQMDGVAAAVRNKVERAAAPLARLDADPDYSLTPHVRDALDLIENAKAHPGTLDDYLNQSGLFTQQRYSPESIELAKKLKDTKPTELVSQINAYGDHARYAAGYEGPGLFGGLPDPKTPRQAFNDAFGTKLPETAEVAPVQASRVPQPSPGFREPEPPQSGAPAAVSATPVRGVPAGQEALDALNAGRAATRAKYGAADVLDRLPGKGVEGRQVFDQAVWKNDSGIERLKAVAKQAPDQMPRLGRAYLEDLFGQASAEGGFDRTQTIFAKWQTLGPQTKELLFPNPMLRQDLDRFFLIAKKAAEKANPSKTALVASVGTQAGLVIADPIKGIPVILGAGLVSKLLHSPAGVRALTEGMSVSLGDKARSVIAANRILRLADAAKENRDQSSNVIPFPASGTIPSAQTLPPASAANR